MLKKLLFGTLTLLCALSFSASAQKQKVKTKELVNTWTLDSIYSDGKKVAATSDFVGMGDMEGNCLLSSTWEFKEGNEGVAHFAEATGCIEGKQRFKWKLKGSSSENSLHIHTKEKRQKGKQINPDFTVRIQTLNLKKNPVMTWQASSKGDKYRPIETYYYFSKQEKEKKK